MKPFKKKAKETAPTQRPFVPTDIALGLGEDEAAQRAAAGDINTPVKSPVKSVKQIILSNIFTYFNMIFIIIGIALIACRSFNHLMFLCVIASNTAIGIIQEIRSKKTLEKLTLLTSPTATVRRSGRDMKIDTVELVRDDLITLGAGDQIPADAVVRDGGISVNESLVTGESDEILKKPGDELLSGSFVVSGSCLCQLTRVGRESFASGITLAAKKSKRSGRSSGMMRSLTLLLYVIGAAIIPMAALLIARQHNALGMSWTDSIVSTAAAILGMIPDGLYLLVSIALAVSVIRLSKKRTLVHELKSIETLARTDVICVDKTGTITDDAMTVTGMKPVPGAPQMSEEFACSLLSDYAAALGGENATMRAIAECFKTPTNRTAVATLPFSSKNKYGGAAFDDGQTYLLGAPEFILGERMAQYETFFRSLAETGSRVLLLARAAGNGFDTSGAEPLLALMLLNRIRENAPATFRYFAEQGVAIKVISGDSPVTASAAAREAGIEGSEKYLDVSSIATDEQLAGMCEDYTVFGRVTPERKRVIIKALKKAGHTVAMTGDGVNDVLALKEANCSIAMDSGSEVTRQVSELVLLDSDFAAMPAVVAEGRRVINNIERSASLFLVKNIFSFFIAWITIIFSLRYPVTPAQLTLVNMLTIGIPSFVLALEPNTSLVKGKFLRNVLSSAAPAAITDIVVLFLTMLFTHIFKIPAAETSTVAATLVALVGFMMLFRVCRPFDAIRRVLFIGMLLLFAVGIFFFSALFSMSPLSSESLLVLVVLTLIAFPVFYAGKHVYRHIDLVFDIELCGQVGLRQSWKMGNPRHVDSLTG